MWVLWYFPMRRWDMAPDSTLEIPRCCRYGDQPLLYLTPGDRVVLPVWCGCNFMRIFHTRKSLQVV